ncbi:hypothetical protein [Paenibacillus taichungensis]
MKQRYHVKFKGGLTIKKCTRCNNSYKATREYFYGQKSSKDGLSSWCKQCRLNYQKGYNNEHKQEYVAYKHEWHKKNKDKVNIKCSNWSKNNREQRNKSLRGFYTRIPEKSNQYRQGRKMKNHKISKKEWEDCKQYFNNSCAYCELPHDQHYALRKGIQSLHDLHKEHYDDDGANDLSNCIPSFVGRNSEKWVFDYEV